MQSPLSSNLANNIRKLRAKRKVSQEELADICGIHRTYIGGIERGERNITLRTLEKIAQALGANPLELLRGGRVGKEN